MVVAPRGERYRAALWHEPSEDGSPPRLRRLAVYPLLGLVIFILGVNWPFLAIGLESISPAWMSVFRLLGAIVTVLIFLGVTGRAERPRRADYPIVVSVAAQLALVFMLVFTALQIVPPGRSSILTWTASLWTVPLAVIFLGEGMNRLRWWGLALGVAGIVAVFEPTRLDWTDSRVVVGHIMLLAAAAVIAANSVHVRHHVWSGTPLALLPFQLVGALIPLLLIALISEGLPTIEWTGELIAIVAYQGVLASGLAVWGRLTVLRSLPAISTNLALMAVPLVGLLSSVVVVDEELTVGVVVGLALVLAGVGSSLIADSRTRVS